MYKTTPHDPDCGLQGCNTAVGTLQGVYNSGTTAMRLATYLSLALFVILAFTEFMIGMLPKEYPPPWGQFYTYPLAAAVAMLVNAWRGRSIAVLALSFISIVVGMGTSGVFLQQFNVIGMDWRQSSASNTSTMLMSSTSRASGAKYNFTNAGLLEDGAFSLQVVLNLYTYLLLILGVAYGFAWFCKKSNRAVDTNMVSSAGLQAYMMYPTTMKGALFGRWLVGVFVFLYSLASGIIGATFALGEKPSVNSYRNPDALLIFACLLTFLAPASRPSAWSDHGHTPVGGMEPVLGSFANAVVTEGVRAPTGAGANEVVINPSFPRRAYAELISAPVTHDAWGILTIVALAFGLVTSTGSFVVFMSSLMENGLPFCGGGVYFESLVSGLANFSPPIASSGISFSFNFIPSTTVDPYGSDFLHEEALKANLNTVACYEGLSSMIMIFSGILITGFYAESLVARARMDRVITLFCEDFGRNSGRKIEKENIEIFDNWVNGRTDGYKILKRLRVKENAGLRHKFFTVMGGESWKSDTEAVRSMSRRDRRELKESMRVLEDALEAP